jgi:hypothetical protein
MAFLDINGATQTVTDTNGNELVKFTEVASAVNELTVSNAATGGKPVLAATGGDTNIGLLIQPKGTGQVTLLSNLAESNVVGGHPVVYLIPVPAGVTGNVDITITYKTRVLDVWLIKKAAAGGGAGTIQVFNGASAITDAMSIDVADKTIVRAVTLDDAVYEIAAAGTLRATRTRTASTDETCLVVVEGVFVA